MITDAGRHVSNDGEFWLAKPVGDAPDGLDLSPLEIGSPLLQEGAELWSGLRSGRRFPSRKDVDPLELPRRLLPHILLIDVMQSDPPDFRWRLIGTHTTQIMQRDVTGEIWTNLYGPDEFMRTSLGPRMVLEHGLPCRTIVRAPLPNRDFLTIESVDLPLSTNGTTIDMILAFNEAS